MIALNVNDDNEEEVFPISVSNINKIDEEVPRRSEKFLAALLLPVTIEFVDFKGNVSLLIV